MQYTTNHKTGACAKTNETNCQENRHLNPIQSQYAAHHTNHSRKSLQTLDL